MSDIQVYSHSQSNNFTIVSNEIINHPTLSLEAKALLIWCLSKPANWKLNTLSLKTIHGISKNKVTTLSKELQEHNYLVIKKGNDGLTTWIFFGTKYDYDLYKNSSVDPIPKPNPQNRDKGKEPDPRIEDHLYGDALISTDLLKRKDKTLCASDDEQLENAFNDLWKTWPAKKNKIAAKKAFKQKMRGKTTKAITEFVNMLKKDILERLRVKEFAADRRDLKKWIVNELYDNVIEPEEEDEKQKAIDVAKEISDRKARELFGKR